MPTYDRATRETVVEREQHGYVLCVLLRSQAGQAMHSTGSTYWFGWVRERMKGRKADHFATRDLLFDATKLDFVLLEQTRRVGVGVLLDLVSHGIMDLLGTGRKSAERHEGKL
jgi:hypothetical protein